MSVKPSGLTMHWILPRDDGRSVGELSTAFVVDL